MKNIKVNDIYLLMEIRKESHQRPIQLIKKFEDMMCESFIEKRLNSFIWSKYVYKNMGYCITDLGNTIIEQHLQNINALTEE